MRLSQSVIASLFAALSVISGSAQADDKKNSATIYQDGSGQSAIINQDGSGNSASIISRGDRNKIDLGQDAPSSSDLKNKFEAYILGNNNLAEVEQIADAVPGANIATITQSGSSNMARMHQGLAAIASGQAGNNIAVITQNGDHNEADVGQYGSDNLAVLAQEGSHNKGDIIQNGAGLSAELTQTGCAVPSGCGTISVTQTGP